MNKKAKRVGKAGNNGYNSLRRNFLTEIQDFLLNLSKWLKILADFPQRNHNPNRCQQCLRKLTQADDYENNQHKIILRIDKINSGFIEN